VRGGGGITGMGSALDEAKSMGAQMSLTAAR
jgi:hypothetical protein